jgi:putative tryptophan/tyrosine transport system substrate-binding protein
MAFQIRRRQLVLALCGVATAWPLVARAQLGERMRRVGAMMLLAENDPEQKAWTEAFRQGMLEAGWTDGRNVQIDYRWGAGDSARARRYATELVALGPDVILAPGSVTVGPLLQATRDIPIVFVHVPDPVGAGFVESLSRPGGNATGFTSFEYGLGGKWLELLKEIAPRVTRVAVVRDPAITTGIGQWGAIQALAPSVGMEAVPVNVHAAEIERTVAAFARSPDGGLIVTGSARAVTHRDLIVALAARHKLPAVYYERVFVDAGGLIAYGPDLVDQYRRSAGYVDRILKGGRPADLPVQAAIKFELAINLKTAKALGLDVPATLLARATEVVE